MFHCILWSSFQTPISWWFGWKCIQTNSGCFSQHSLGPQQPTNGLVRWEFTSFYSSKWPLPHFGDVLIGLPTRSRVWHTDQLPVDLTCDCFPLLRSGPKFHLVVLAWCDQAHNEKQAEKSKNQRCWFQIWVLLLEVQRWRMKPFNDPESNFLHCIYHLLLNTTPVSSLHRVACSAGFQPSRNPQLTSSIQRYNSIYSVTRNPKTIIGVVLTLGPRNATAPGKIAVFCWDATGRLCLFDRRMPSE